MSAPLLVPQAGLIQQVVTRSVIARKDRYHLSAVYDAAGRILTLFDR